MVDDVANMAVETTCLADPIRIALHLDRETSRLDALLTAKEHLIALLAEKRRPLVAQAVSRGLDVSAPMCDSDFPWLTQIPKSWKVRRARFLFRQSALAVHDHDEIVTCFRHGQVTLRRNRREDGFTKAVMELGYQGIRNGQLMLHSMDAFAGALGVSDSDGKCWPEYIIRDPATGEIDSQYYGYLLRQMALVGFIQASCPAVRERAPRIRFSDFGEMFLPLPPKEEQRSIVRYITRETAKIDSVRFATAQTITLLKERRAGRALVMRSAAKGGLPAAAKKLKELQINPFRFRWAPQLTRTLDGRRALSVSLRAPGLSQQDDAVSKRCHHRQRHVPGCQFVDQPGPRHGRITDDQELPACAHYPC